MTIKIIKKVFVNTKFRIQNTSESSIQLTFDDDLHLYIKHAHVQVTKVHIVQSTAQRKHTFFERTAKFRCNQYIICSRAEDSFLQPRTGSFLVELQTWEMHQDKYDSAFAEEVRKQVVRMEHLCSE